MDSAVKETSYFKLLINSSGRRNTGYIIDSMKTINLTLMINIEITDILLHLNLPLSSNKLIKYVNYVTC